MPELRSVIHWDTASEIERVSRDLDEKELKGVHQLVCELAVRSGGAAEALQRRQVAPGD